MKAQEGGEDPREERVVFSPQSRGPESQQGRSVGLQAPLRECTAAVSFQTHVYLGLCHVAGFGNRVFADIIY